MAGEIKCKLCGNPYFRSILLGETINRYCQYHFIAIKQILQDNAKPNFTKMAMHNKGKCQCCNGIFDYVLWYHMKITRRNGKEVICVEADDSYLCVRCSNHTFTSIDQAHVIDKNTCKYQIGGENYAEERSIRK